MMIAPQTRGFLNEFGELWDMHVRILIVFPIRVAMI